MFGRLAAAAGGVAGLASLALPYALVTGSALGFTAEEESYTLLGFAQLLADAGRDPGVVYALAAAIAVGSALALAGAVASRWLALVGGILQGGSAAAYLYGVATQGVWTFLVGFAQFTVRPEQGVYVLAVGAALSLASLPLSWLAAD